MKVSRKSERGFTLLEVLIAATILFVCASGVLALFGLAVMQSSAQGDRGTRTIEYAQDKMEQLMALSFSDSTSDLTQYPTVTGTCCGLAAGGSVDPANPATGYVDYIATNGTPQANSTGAAYIREWTIANDSNSPPQIKTITVLVKQLNATGAFVPSTTLMSQKCSTDN
jgi:prepilin-type N-terminal cleavage/methylation domain-containing protein